MGVVVVGEAMETRCGVQLLSRFLRTREGGGRDRRRRKDGEDGVDDIRHASGCVGPRQEATDRSQLIPARGTPHATIGSPWDFPSCTLGASDLCSHGPPLSASITCPK